MDNTFSKFFTKTRLSEILLTVISVSITLVFVEIGLRIIKDDNRFLPYHTNSTYYNYPSEKISPGVSGVSAFSTNDLGLRGRPIEDEKYKILTIGGSTTSDDILDDEETWSHQLMGFLNAEAGANEFVWVGSSGIAGKNSEHHVIHAKYLLPVLPTMDWVIIHAGTNDVGRWLYAKSYNEIPLMDKNQNAIEDVIGQSFRVSGYTPSDYPMYKRLEIWKLLSVAKNYFLVTYSAEYQDASIVMDRDLEWLENERAKRKERKKKFIIRSKLNTLPVALSVYAENLKQIISLVRQNGAEPVFVPQVMPGFKNMTEEDKERFWMGAMDGGDNYIDESQFVEMLQYHNEKMKEVSETMGVHYIDLPELLGNDPSLFYDNLHYNEHGARMVGQAIGRYFQQNIIASGLN